MSPKFLEHRVRRLVCSKGKSYTFMTMGLDNYKQSIPEGSVTIEGLYHEQNSYISALVSDAAVTQRKKTPMILALMTQEVMSLKTGDKTLINGVSYKISGILDIQNYGVVADISLEMEV